MSGLKESQKQVRLEMVAGGLSYLISSGKPLTRKQFFLTDREPLDANKRAMVLRENASKNWQRGVIERLMKSNIIKQDYKDGITTKDIKYIIDDELRAKKIYNDYLNNGLLLSAFVFPNQVAMSPDFEPKEEFVAEVNLGEAQEQTDEKPKQEVELSLDELFKTMISYVVSLKNDFNANNDNQIAALKSIVSYLKTNEEDNKEIVSTNKQIEKDINGLKNRIEKVETVIGDTKKLLETNQATTKRLIEAVDKMNIASEQINSLVSGNHELQQTAKELVKELKSARGSRLESLANRLESLSTETKNLSELVLDATTNTDK